MKWLYLMLWFSLSVQADIRHDTTRRSFAKMHPCPATGQSNPSCPGYVIDHGIPLCAGGPDDVANMAWQEKQESFRKDAWERRLCARLRRQAAPTSTMPTGKP